MKKRSFAVSIILCAVTFLACAVSFIFVNIKNAVKAHAANDIWWKLSGTTLILGDSSLSGAQGFDSSTTTTSTTVPWNTNRADITSVNISSSISPKCTSYWFYNFSKLVTVNNLQNLNMSNVAEAVGMFWKCTSLNAVDVKNWDVSSLTTVASMFRDCTSLKSIDISGWDTSKLANTFAMFSDSTSLESLNLENFDASALIRIEEMFRRVSVDKIKLSESLAKKLAAMYASDPTNTINDSNLTFPLYDLNGNKYDLPSDLTKGGAYFTSPHVHDYKETDRKNATCDTDGYITKTCSESFCADVLTETTVATGHTMSSVAAKLPTCTESGNIQHYHCSNCNKNFEDIDGDSEITTVIANATGHKWSSEWSSNGNEHWHVCENGDCTAINGSGEHSWGTPVVTEQPTEDKNGKKTVTCTVCDYEKEETIAPLAHTHKFAEGWTSDETNHWHAATCGHATETSGFAAHTFPDSWETDSEATEEAAGSKHRDCTVCGYRQTQTIPQLNHEHKYDNWTDEAHASCTETGTKGHYACTCGLYFDQQHNQIDDLTIAALDHNWASVWSKDETNHWHACSRCDEINDNAAHTYEWIITKEPTEEAEGLKEEKCTVCEYANGNVETIAKLVVDDNGNVSDLPPDNDYDLEIAVKESESKYNVAGVNKGYVVELYIVNGEDRTPYGADKSVILKLVIPEGMDEFVLYRMSGDRLTEVAADEYKVEGGMLSIRTTLPDEFVFNAPVTETEEPSAGIPWWVWLLVGLVAVAIIGVVIIIIVVIKKKNGGDGGTTVVQGTNYDDAELKAKLSAQDKKLDEIKEIVDGGFNDVVDGE